MKVPATAVFEARTLLASSRFLSFFSLSVVLKNIVNIRRVNGLSTQGIKPLRQGLFVFPLIACLAPFNRLFFLNG